MLVATNQRTSCKKGCPLLLSFILDSWSVFLPPPSREPKSLAEGARRLLSDFILSPFLILFCPSPLFSPPFLSLPLFDRLTAPPWPIVLLITALSTKTKRPRLPTPWRELQSRTRSHLQGAPIPPWPPRPTIHPWPKQRPQHQRHPRHQRHCRRRQRSTLNIPS